MNAREFHSRIAKIGEQAAESGIALEAYLRSLVAVLDALEAKAAFSPEEFVSVLEGAATTPPGPPPQARPLSPRYVRPEGPATHAELRDEILSQVWDLRTLEGLGKLADPYRESGLECPGGASWFNYEVEPYLECASAGTFGESELRSRDGDGSAAFTPIDWATFIDFVDSGRYYE